MGDVVGIDGTGKFVSAQDAGFPDVPDYEQCSRCHRKLLNPKWRRVGLGPVCFSKDRYERYMAEAKANGWTHDNTTLPVTSNLPKSELSPCECGHEAGGHSAVPPHACVMGVRNPAEFGECEGGTCNEWRRRKTDIVDQDFGA